MAQYARLVEYRNIPTPAFADDEGNVEPRLARALARYADDRVAESEVLAALGEARLIIPVVAVLTDSEVDRFGVRRDKSSEMAVPTIQAPDGRRALLAFTSVPSLARWRADARPVAVTTRQAIEAALREKAGTVLVDIAGPVTYQLTGAALRALAEGRLPLPAATDPDVVAAVRAALAAEPAVRRAYLVQGPRAGGEADATVGLVVVPGAPVPEVAKRVAAALSADEVLRTRLDYGLELAVLPEGTTLPVVPLFTR